MKEDFKFANNKICIGQNANDNDELVKISRQTDMWFHLADFPSCHVVITQLNEYPIPDEMILYCAS